MRWELRSFDDGSGSWVAAETQVGTWSVEERGGAYLAMWLPGLGADTNAEVWIGHYRTEGAAKGACKRYAKKMAAAFKAMAKAGWQ